MNHKKIIALTAAISMLTFSGCSSSQETAENADTADISVAAEMEADAPSETNSAEEESSAETSEEASDDASAETGAKPAEGLSAEEAYSTKNGASWTDALMTSSRSWDKGNIVFRCTAREDGEIVTDIEMSSYNSKVYMNTEIPGLMTMTMIFDGEKCYMIDRATKTYSLDTENTYDADSEVESIVDTTADYSSFTEDGIENIDGTDYIYEKYIADDSEAVFYYSPEGRLLKMGAGGNIADLTIDLLDEPDESCFVIPEDYTEISMEEMSMNMMAGLLDAMEDISEDSSEAE